MLHEPLHAPASHSKPAEHALPHFPQFCGSVASRVHAPVPPSPPQESGAVGGQEQVPATQA